MGTIAEQTQFDATVNQIENGDTLSGGAGGTFNLAVTALADRTQYLKSKTDGIHTITDASAPGSSSGTLDVILGWLANRILAITGKTHWTDTPDATLATAAAHIANTNDPHQSLHQAYPVGSLYFNSANNANPASLLGFGTWAAYGAGRMLLGVGSDGNGNSYTAGQTGGESTHLLTTAEMPSHNHSIDAVSQVVQPNANVNTTVKVPGAGTSGNAGGGQAHNNMPPYIALYIWTRTA